MSRPAAVVGLGFTEDMKLAGLSASELATLIPLGTVLLGYRGSIAHGMYRNPADHADAIDDKDLLGVCIPSPEHYLGLKTFEQKETQLKEWDVVVYEYRKFVRLLCGANPNVLSLLWLEPHFYVHRHPAGQVLLDHRQDFMTRKLYHAFTGYAYGQLKRMTHFGDGAYATGYMGAKRKALVEKFGYDTKNAAHLIRLLRMGIEALKEGSLLVRRPDAPQLMEIKLGAWTLEQVKAEADHLFGRAEAAYDACTLPKEPDHAAISRWVTDVVAAYLPAYGPETAP